jgi:pimeloyl-ACP methyl ester carboxylesterase
MTHLSRCTLRVAALVVCVLASPAAAQSRSTVLGMQVERHGEAGPVVVFENGMGERFASWQPVARRLAPCMRLVLYDRTGIGASGPRREHGPRLADQVADTLKDLLGALGIAPPYILVGHSLGGLYMQAFARKHPADIGGVVLVDGVSPLEPPGAFENPKMAAGTIAEAEVSGLEPSIAAMRAGPPFPPVPLVVMSARLDVSPELQAIWRDTHVRTATLSPKGRLVVLDDSGHFIQTDRPQAVADAVLSVARESGADVSACSGTPSKN